MSEYAKVLLALAGVVFLACLLLVGLLKLNSPAPKTEIEAYLDQVIREAEISDQYDLNGAGWDSQDVTDKVCDRVDVAALKVSG